MDVAVPVLSMWMDKSDILACLYIYHKEITQVADTYYEVILIISYIIIGISIR